MYTEIFLSKVLGEMDPSLQYEIFDEKPFKLLGLTVHKLSEPMCVFVDNAENLNEISSTVTMVLTTKKIAPLLSSKGIGVCVVDKPRIVFFKLMNYLVNLKLFARDHKKTIVGINCKISDRASISQYNVVIGDNVTIEENVVIRENTRIGNNVIIRAGSIIGGYGFEFKRDNNEILSVLHSGGVVIKDHVEIQYNTTVDCALYVWDDTIIDEYTKIDNQVYVAHGVKIGKRTLITANSVIGGRTTIGDDCWLGFSTTVRNGIEIGDRVRLNMGAVVTKNVCSDSSVTGNFAIDHELFIRNLKAKIE